MEKVEEQLKKLEAYQFLSYVPRNDKPQVLFLTEFVGTRCFGLSKENYHDRKREAELRVKAVIDFVNNDEECRSVQLLRYFNEKKSNSCGRCDVCLKHRPASVDYQTIEDRLVSVVTEMPMSMSEVMAQCHELDCDKVLDSIRFLVDNGVLGMDKEGRLSQKGNKKSRQE